MPRRPFGRDHHGEPGSEFLCFLKVLTLSAVVEDLHPVRISKMRVPPLVELLRITRVDQLASTSTLPRLAQGLVHRLGLVDRGGVPAEDLERDAREKPLTGRVALVTGASRRIAIGAAVVRRLVADGAAVLVHSWSPHDAEQPWGADHDGVETLIGG